MLYPLGLTGTLYPLGLHFGLSARSLLVKFCLNRLAIASSPVLALTIAAFPLPTLELAELPTTALGLTEQPATAVEVAPDEWLNLVLEQCDHAVDTL
jgi:hypothetical protein